MSKNLIRQQGVPSQGHKRNQNKNKKDKNCPQVIEDQAILWNDHIWYTTRFLVAAVNTLGELQTDVKELLQNQIDIGANFAQLFGVKAGDKLAKLLVEHILIAADIVNAVLAGDSAKVAELQVAWSANGRQIAKFYSKKVCTTKYKKLAKMWQEHLDATTVELVTLVDQDYEANAEALDAVLEHMQMWSHYLSKSICRSFGECECKEEEKKDCGCGK
jgi:hypothetical protein